MLNAVRRFFDEQIGSADQAHGGQDVSHRMQVAAAALLLEVSRVDYQSDDVELAAIGRALRSTFGLQPDETATLLELARQEADDAVSLHGFTRLINENFSRSEKVQLLEMLWQVAYADASLDKYEEHLIRRISDLLYLSHSEFMQTKHKAQRRP